MLKNGADPAKKWQQWNNGKYLKKKHDVLIEHEFLIEHLHMCKYKNAHNIYANICKYVCVYAYAHTYLYICMHDFLIIMPGCLRKR